MKIVYEPKGTCSTSIEIDVKDGIIENVKFTGGCPGNLLAMSDLVRGMAVSDTIARLEGLKCGHKQTSCPDQLAQALKTIGS